MFKVGHGMAVYDAMRDLGGVEGPLADVEVRRAGPGDREVFHGLRMGLVDYLAGPPVYLVTGEDKPEEYYNDWLGNPTRSVWLAYHQDEPVGYIQACTLDESVLVTDEKTAWIQGAFTKPHQRGQGIAATLLRRCIEWVREQGCGRCAVDFEGENVLGRRFWLKHFEPVDLSLVRHLDRRVAG
jgi:GNAT superfamily N-acetyltransferase